MTIFLSEDYMPAVNLNRPAIEPGQITEADLAAARQHSSGRILNTRRVTLLPAGCDQQGRHDTRQRHPWPDTEPTDYSELERLDSCAAEGGKPRAPVAAPRQSWLCSAWLRLVRWLA